MCVYSKRLSAQECLEHAWLRQEQDICQHVTSSSTAAEQSESETVDNTNNTADTSAAELETKTIHRESSSLDENELIVSKSAITCITLELVSEKLDVIQEHHSEKKSDSPAAARDEKCSVHISEQDRDLLLAATSGESSENSQPDSCETCSDNRDSMTTSSLSTGGDTAVQRKIFKELTNQRAAAVVASPLASPIGCRRQLTSSPETITEIEPVKKHHCRRDAQQLSLIMNSSSDLHVHVKVESKVWDLDDVVLEDNSAIVTKREKEIVVTS